MPAPTMGQAHSKEDKAYFKVLVFFLSVLAGNFAYH
jgi:hypothetical protein